MIILIKISAEARTNHIELWASQIELCSFQEKDIFWKNSSCQIFTFEHDIEGNIIGETPITIHTSHPIPHGYGSVTTENDNLTDGLNSAINTEMKHGKYE
jgi:hypothetical protein